MLITGRPAALLLGLAVAAGAALFVALISGSADIGVSQVMAALRGDVDSEIITTVLE